MRKPFIAANWKMNKTTVDTRDFLDRFVPDVRHVTAVDIVIAPPFTSLALAAEMLRGTNIILAGQNAFYEEKGAYTGEISPSMLADIGCRYVIVGHSERRQYFLEDDGIVNRKTKAAKKAGLGVIVCVGELLAEREGGRTFEILERQIEKGLKEIPSENMVIAYEPVWAIGTGKTATPEQAQDTHAYIRGKLRVLYGNRADEFCIIYGGSVTPDNVDSLMACGDVDGALVGGASLKADAFTRIVNFRKVQ
jgi:triosephosphate isomerase